MAFIVLIATLLAPLQAVAFALPRPQIGFPGLGGAVGTTVGAGVVTGVGVGITPVVVAPPSIPAVLASSAKSSTGTTRSSSAASSGPTAAAPPLPNAPIPPAPTIEPVAPSLPVPSSAIAGIPTPAASGLALPVPSSSIIPLLSTPSLSSPTASPILGLDAIWAAISSILGSAPVATVTAASGSGLFTNGMLPPASILPVTPSISAAITDSEASLPEIPPTAVSLHLPTIDSTATLPDSLQLSPLAGLVTPSTLLPSLDAAAATLPPFSILPVDAPTASSLAAPSLDGQLPIDTASTSVFAAASNVPLDLQLTSVAVVSALSLTSAPGFVDLESLVTATPSLPTIGPTSPSLPTLNQGPTATPSSAAQSLAISIPAAVLSSLAPPDVPTSMPDFPNLPDLGTAGIMSVLQITTLTTVALTDTAALESLGALQFTTGTTPPQSTDAPGLPTAQLPTTPFNVQIEPTPSLPASPDASAVASNIPPMPSAPSVASVLDTIGVELVQSLASAMMQLMNILDAAREPVAEAADITSGATASLPSVEITSLTAALPTPSPFSIDTASLTTLPPSLTTSLASDSPTSTTSSIEDPNKHKRAPPGLPPIPILPGFALPGLNNLPIGAQVQTPSATAAAALSLEPSPALPSRTLPSQPAASSPAADLPTDTNLPTVLSVPTVGNALPSGPALPLGQLLPSTQILPSQYYDAVAGAPVIGSTTLPIAAGSTVLSIVTSLPIPSELPLLIQGVKNAAIAPLLSLPGVDRVAPLLALLRLLALMNVGQFGSLATLTDLPAAQSAVAMLDTPDLLTVVEVLESRSVVYSTAADGLLADAVGFVRVVEALVPVVGDLRAVVAYVILQQLGLTAVGNVVDGTVVESLPGGGGGV